VSGGALTDWVMGLHHRLLPQGDSYFSAAPPDDAIPRHRREQSPIAYAQHVMLRTLVMGDAGGPNVPL